MDCKIINKLFLIIIFFTSTHLNAVEFKGKFLQGHFIVGKTDPLAKIIIGKKEAIKKIPLGRVAEESDVATAVAFLAADSSAMITGTSLVVDGGWTAQ